MGLQAEIVVPRYVVLTQLADSWIPRASHGDADSAEAEAFRWRRIYGPRRTRVAEYWIPQQEPEEHRPAVTDVIAETITALPAAGPQPCHCPTWREAALRAFALYLGFSLANKGLELLILLAG
ncbi:hypothetical protein [Ferrovibrio sp.]|uniref:hypothetical protein n=1 Tax=Ferrovibrio sp. TaxID=1917215 RepID=UPI00311DE459